VGLTTAAPVCLSVIMLQNSGAIWLDVILLILYIFLFFFVSLSFWTSVVGFFTLMFKRNRLTVTEMAHGSGEVPVGSRTAVVMPICNEQPGPVFARLRAVADSLIKGGWQNRFDIYILSDTNDPAIRAQEVSYFSAMDGDLGEGIHIVYRNRRVNAGRKVGNLRDFCHRWGQQYRYMIVLDADSLMSGDTLLNLVRVMEKNPKLALIQLPTVVINQDSLFGRIMQFAGRLYGPITTAGLSYWYLSESNYWGHNAILRIKPYMDHCELPVLPGREPFGGEILSHDFIEAALLRKAGWQAWFAYDLGGSFEEVPANLIDFIRRDRRWCQGNLQHIRLLSYPGFHGINRLHLGAGIMSYLSSPLWLIFLALAATDVYLKSGTPSVWPAIMLLLTAIALSNMPRLLSLIVVLRNSGLRRSFGGGSKIIKSAFLETIFSTLFVPIMGLYQSRFVLSTLFRNRVKWEQQQREGNLTKLQEALSVHGWQTIIGITAVIIALLNLDNLVWCFLIAHIWLIVSIPFSVVTSRIDLGLKAKKRGLFLTPEEITPPPVVKAFWKNVKNTPVP
jgi:membrane glycosyltransferase